MTDPEKINKAKKIFLVLGGIAIIMGLMIESILDAMSGLFETMGISDWITPTVSTIMMILYIVGGITLIVGALMLESNFKTGKLLIIIASLPMIKDLGIVTLILAFVMLKDD